MALFCFLAVEELRWGWGFALGCAKVGQLFDNKTNTFRFYVSSRSFVGRRCTGWGVYITLGMNNRKRINNKALRACVIALSLIAGPTIADVGGDTRDAELKNLDRELNSVYSKITQKLEPKAQQKLKAAQRTWLQMRDLDCEWAYIDKRDCLIDRTANRTNELKNTDFSAKDGIYSSLDK